MPAEMTDRRFPPPWTLDEHDECFIVRDANGQALGYFYFGEEQQSPAIDRRLTRDDARRMAVNFARLPDLICPPSALVGQIRQIEEGSVSGSS